MLSIPFRSRDTRDLAWQYIQQNWDKVTAQLTKWSAGEFVWRDGKLLQRRVARPGGRILLGA